MAFALPPTVITAPEFTVVTQYTVERMGMDPGVRVFYTAAVVEKEATTYTVDSMLGDPGAYTGMVISQLATRTDMLGRTLYLDSETVGTVLEFAAGNITLVEPVVSDYTGQAISLAQYNNLGLVLHRATGAPWACFTNDNARLGSVMFNVHYAAVIDVLDEAGITYDPGVIAVAIQSLMANGTSIDSYLCAMAEEMEIDRRAGDITIRGLDNSP